MVNNNNNNNNNRILIIVIDDNKMFSKLLQLIVRLIMNLVFISLRMVLK